MSINRFDTIAKKTSPPLIDFWSSVGWNLREIQMRNVDRPSDDKQKTCLSMSWRWMKLFVDVRTMNEVVCLWSDDEWINMIVQHIKYWNIGRSINVNTLLIFYDIIELNSQINSDRWTRESKRIIKQKDKLSCEKRTLIN